MNKYFAILFATLYLSVATSCSHRPYQYVQYEQAEMLQSYREFKELQEICWYIRLQKTQHIWSCHAKKSIKYSVSSPSVYTLGNSKEEVVRKALAELK